MTFPDFFYENYRTRRLVRIQISRNIRKHTFAFRKHAYSAILKISAPKTESFQIKILIFFHISAQNIDCGYSLEPPRRGGSNECPQSMFLSRNKKNNVYPCKPQFYCIKVGFKRSKLYRYIFVMGNVRPAKIQISLRIRAV